MKVSIAHSIDHYRYQTKKLLNKLLNPSFGTIQEIGFLNNAYNDPNFLISGGVLTGVHLLLDREDPGRTAYHIGGAGFSLDEPMIKTLAESVERYAQLLAEIADHYTIKFTSYDDMIANAENVISFDKFTFFSQEQLSRKHFPFRAGKKDQPISWIQLTSLSSQQKVWVPAQLVFFGYRVRLKDGEPWMGAGVSTGTAAHVTYLQAKRNALLELIQLDSAMGHWYTDYPVFEILFDDRTRFLERLLKKVSAHSNVNIRFFFLENPDLKGFSIAAVLFNNGKRLPKVAVGLGADTSLVRAMYKATLEGIGTLALARLEIYKSKYSLDRPEGIVINPDRIYNLDQNSEYYGRGNDFWLIEQRFLNSKKKMASEFPSDMKGSFEVQVEELVASFLNSNKELYETNLNLREVEDLGFYVNRVWSPDALPLCLPSSVQAEHPRFNSYGGIVRENPHPYP